MTEERAHALLGASSSHRWLNCTPSARLTDDIDDEGSVFAQEGTLAHSLAELELSRELKLIKKAEYNKKLKEIQADDLFAGDMPSEIEKYTNWVLEAYAAALATTKDALIFLEQRLDYSSWVPEGFGTGDCIIIADGVMEVIDLKYGKGVEVYAEDNTQMMLYALGALDAYSYIYDIDAVRMTVAQPRLDNFSSWEMTEADLIVWAETVLKPKAALAYEGLGSTLPGDWCRWCKVKATCRARLEQVEDWTKDFEIESDDEEGPEFAGPETLTDSEVAGILAWAEAVQKWAKEVQDYAFTQALKGVKFEGWKLVEGRSTRKYIDEEAVLSYLLSEGYSADQVAETKVLGITKMTKALGGAKNFDALVGKMVHKPEGKPTLVPEYDPRPELAGVENDFSFED